MFFPCQFTGALELEFGGGLNLLTYHPDKQAAHSGSEEYRKFQTYPFAIANVSVRGDITNTLAVSINAVSDNVLLNSVNVLFSNRTDYFRFEFGPFAGIGDKAEIPDLGIKGSIEFTIPGIAFLTFGGSSTLGSGFEFASDNVRESAEAKFGFWLPNLIPSVAISTKSSTRQANDFMTLRDTLTRLTFSADLFFKNTNAAFRIDVGNETYTRLYKGGSEETTDELNAWFVGAEFRFQVSKPLRLIAGIEMPVIYTAAGFVKKTPDNPLGEVEHPMIAPDFLWNMFKANAGIVITVF